MVNRLRALQVFLVGTFIMTVLIGIKTQEEIRQNMEVTDDDFIYVLKILPVFLMYSCGWGLVPVAVYVVSSIAYSWLRPAIGQWIEK